MRRSLLLATLALLALLAAPSPSQASLVQSCANAQFDGTPIGCTLPSSVGAHHHLVVTSVVFNVLCRNDELSDTLGLMVVAATSYLLTSNCQALGSNNLTLNIYCVQTQTTTGAETFSASDQAGRSGVYIIVAEYSGLTEAAATSICTQDGAGSNNGNTSGATFATGNLTTSNANDLLISSAWYYSIGNTTGLTVNAPYVSEVYYNTCTNCSNQVSHMLADRTVSATGTYQGTFNGAQAATDWMAVQVALPTGPTTIIPAKRKHPPYIIKWWPRRREEVPQHA
jgi:hypothetical protein